MYRATEIDRNYGKELGHQSKAQARLPSAIFVFFCGFSSASRVSFKSSIV